MKTLDTDAAEDVEHMTEYVSQQIYVLLCDIHESLADGLQDDKAASDILVNALSINLGHIIGQLPATQQKRYASMTKKTIKEHTLIGNKEKDKLLYGSIGNA